MITVENGVNTNNWSKAKT